MSRAIRTLVVDDEALGRARLVRLLMACPDVLVVGQSKDGPEALGAIDALAPDVVFLDVQMDGMDGFDVLRSLGPELGPVVVFVTAYERHAVDAFEVAAADYLLKPVAPERLALALERVRERIRAREASAATHAEFGRKPIQRIAARRRDGIRFIDCDEVEYCAAEGNYVRVFTGGESMLVRETMQTLEERLKPVGFIRIHRRYLVRDACIQELSPLANGEQRVRLSSGVVLDSGRTYRHKLRTALGLDDPDGGF